MRRKSRERNFMFRIRESVLFLSKGAEIVRLFPLLCQLLKTSKIRLYFQPLKPQWLTTSDSTVDPTQEGSIPASGRSGNKTYKNKQEEQKYRYMIVLWSGEK